VLKPVHADVGHLKTCPALKQVMNKMCCEFLHSAQLSQAVNRAQCYFWRVPNYTLYNTLKTAVRNANWNI